jgi:transposase
MLECGGKEIYLVCGPTDMRKGIDGLSAVVDLRLCCDSYESALFVFCNKSRNSVKVLEWDQDGFWLYQKRLEKGTFPWPDNGSVKKLLLSEHEFSCLVSGTKLRRRLKFEEVFPGPSA